MSEMACVVLADFLQGEPAAVRKLLAEHVDDGRGHCRSCAVGGQRGYQTWPCTIYQAAAMAHARLN